MSTAGRTIRLRYAASVNDDALPEDTSPDYELHYIDIGNVDSSGAIGEIADYKFADAPSRARRKVKHGDIIISTVRTYLQAIAAITQPPPNMVVSTGFAVVRPIDGVIDADYCRFALRDPEFLAEVQKRSVGVSYPAINVSDLRDIPVHIHSIAIQRAIADYLDRQTGRIDSLVAAKQRLLGILAEKRRMLITIAVTAGLSPDAPKRDASVPWLGQIPEHWKVRRARWLFRERDERTQEEENELLTVSHITGVTARSEKDVNMFEAETKEGYKICKRGDFAINTMWAWMGAMGVSPIDGIVSPSYNVYVPNGELISGYLDALVRIPPFRSEVIRHSKGVWSSRLRLYPEQFFQICLPIPPPIEQQAIVAHIETETGRLDALMATTERSIELLKERRGALIAAAVTGQIRLPGAI